MDEPHDVPSDGPTDGSKTAEPSQALTDAAHDSQVRFATAGAALFTDRRFHALPQTPRPFPINLAQDERRQLQIYRASLSAENDGEHITNATRWFLDNYYTISETYRHLRRDLRPEGVKSLPRDDFAGTGPLPRSLALAWDYLTLTDSEMRERSFTDYISGAQQVHDLTIAELWSLPTMLRYGLALQMLELTEESERGRMGRRAANAVMERLMASDKPAADAFSDIVDEAMLSNTAYVSQLIYRLHTGFDGAHAITAELSHRLEAQGVSPDQLLVQEQSRQATNTVTAGNIIRALKRVDEIDWSDWFESVSRTEDILRRDPDHLRLSRQTRGMVRNRIESIARRSAQTETQVAQMAVAAAAEKRIPVSVVLLGTDAESFEKLCGYRPTWRESLLRFTRRHGVISLVVPLVILLILEILWLTDKVLPDSDLAHRIVLVVLSLPALAEAALALIRLIASRLVQPARLPAYDFKKGIPPENAALVVIPCLLISRDTIDDLLASLEVHYLGNTDPALSFALLTDYRDAPSATTPEDAGLLGYARAGIEALNRKYPRAAPLFFLLHRRRQWNDSEGVWMGWERKRGKLSELNALLRGSHDTSFLPGSRPVPHGIRYVVTLDADTHLPRDTAATLVGMMAHPVNRPYYDPQRRRITEGHGLIQPRISTLLTLAGQTSPYQQIMSQDAGLDPYVFAVSDLYQDYFDQGTYTGKGIYDVDAFRQAAEDPIRENTVLSHDLIEGAWLRAALASDVTFIEEYPQRFDVDLARQHRWVRGDWQLLPYLFDRHNGLDALAKVRILDNLRRSLLPATLMLACLVALLGLPLHEAMIWIGALAISICVAQILGWMIRLIPGDSSGAALFRLRGMAQEFAAQILAFIIRFILLPQTAWSMGDAILRSLYRVGVSGKNRLEWTTADAVTMKPRHRIWDTIVLMRGGLALTVVFVLLVLFLRPDNSTPALVFGLLWLSGPVLAWATALPPRNEGMRILAPEAKLAWRAEGRLIWRFFETFVDDKTHQLPPDNYQDNPVPKVAARTSPTNIGLYFLSVVSAHEFSWITLDEALTRIEATLATVEKLDRHRGHLFNWYDTDSLKPLGTRYISSVDSGNLAGHLVTLSSTLKAWARNPALHIVPDFAGAVDILTLLRRLHPLVPRERRSLALLHERIAKQIDWLWQSIPDHGASHVVPLNSGGFRRAASDLRLLVQAMASETQSDRASELEWWANRLVVTCQQAEGSDQVDPATMVAVSQRMETLSERVRAIAFGMDFKFLLDSERQLLTVGFNCDEDRADQSFYDLLQSEARLASLFGIAKGDLPTAHWGRLGRPMAVMSYGSTLISWSGSMFEYLMAPLVMDERPGSILYNSCAVAVDAQIRDGHKAGLPWGVSESAYNARDALMNYQYHAFGSPELALQRWLRDDRVVAPYATFLAAPFKPVAALKNLRKLADLGARGPYGFYDAVDFTSARVPEGERSVVVQTVMAHHLGMSLLAVANTLRAGIHRTRFAADPVIESVTGLLQLKAPKEVTPLDREALALKSVAAPVGGAEVVRLADTTRAPHTVAIMSNGRLTVLLDATGGGRARIKSMAITRWRPDPVRDVWGDFLFIRNLDTGRWWGATAAPAFDPGIAYSAQLYDYKANFSAIGEGLSCETEVVLSDDLDAKAMRVKLRNISQKTLQLELSSYAEVVLDNNDADRAHSVFSRMFVATEADCRGARIFARRNKRAPDDPDLHLLHFAQGAGLPVSACTDRRNFIGRGRTVRNPQALENPTLCAPAPSEESFTLDPITSLTRRISLPPGKEASVTFWTVFADSRATLEAAQTRLSDEGAFDHEHQMAWTRSQIQLHHTDISPEDAAVFRRYAALLVYPNQVLNARNSRAKMGLQSALWPIAVSGDNPMMVLRISDLDSLPVAQQAIRMQEYLRLRGLECDLVILNEQRVSYSANLQESLNNFSRGMHLLHSRPSLFAVESHALAPETLETLLGAARVVLFAENGSLIEQINRPGLTEPALSVVPPTPKPVMAAPIQRDFPPEDLRFWNGFGGFDATGNYLVRLRHGQRTPDPWINVIARDNFGFHVSAAGAAFSWSANSRDHQLTPWSNDPVSNIPGEGILIRDVTTGALHTPFAALSTQADALYTCRHGTGFSTFTAWSGALEITATLTLDPTAPVRLTGLRISNRGTVAMVLDVAQFLDPVMGSSRAKAAPYLLPRFIPEANAIQCTNPYSIDYPGQQMTLSLDRIVTGMCLSRPVWQGRNRPTAQPVWFDQRRTGRIVTQTDGDPLMMLETRIEIAPGAVQELTFRLSAGHVTETGAQPSTSPADALAAQIKDWEGLLGKLVVQTPDPAFDLMVNRWLPYQAIACRIRARSAFYQASGAYGFRDQLQDTSAMLLYDPHFARSQLLEAASRQFPEGDVQHWWLPGSGAGVRTTIADDVVWLGNCLARYVGFTGDRAILDAVVPFIEGRALAPGEHDAFYTPEISQHSATLYDHAALALDLALQRTGERGLPLFLGGDWNDGMNLVGVEGRGQSVWLGWFLAQTLDLLVPIAQGRGDAARAEKWQAHRSRLAEALDSQCWDGDWYLRGFYDDGTPLGSHLSDECRIDTIAQSWAVISGVGSAQHTKSALDAAVAHLWDDEGKLLRIFAPPFAKTAKDPGYIKGYPPGVRENGGQYTHAAIWMAMALCEAGRNDEAWRLFQMLNPITHGQDPETLAIYRGEPYAVAADVYGIGEKRGRAGWTWYTGSAGWFHRVAVEHLLGLRVHEGGTLEVKPALPSHWPGYQARIDIAGVSHQVTVTRDPSGEPRVTVKVGADGAER